MFGMEKSKKDVFQFDLEIDIKKSKQHKDKIVKDVEGKIHELKTILRQGTSNDEDFEAYGVLLRGYAALQKVISRIV